MCEEVLQYKKLHNNNFTDYYNLKDIDEDGETLLEKFYKNKAYNLSSDDIATNIIEIAKIMGFKIFYSALNGINRNISGIIGISKNLKNKYKSDKVIMLNSNDSDEHMLFTIAHEISHYIFDYNPKTQLEYFNKYNTEEVQTDQEIRANRFAAAIMMPEKKFKNYYNNKLSISDNIDILSVLFNVPKTAVKRRIIELELNTNE